MMSIEKSIFVNQIGYNLLSSKQAFARGAAENEEFCVIDSNNKIVYRGTVKAPKKDIISNEEICSIDFSDFCTPGTYSIKIGECVSVPFKIGEGIFDDLFYSSLNYFYLSRCGQDIEGEEWSHPACHTGKSVVYGTQEIKDVQGGWHDAGDYGRYVVAGAKAVMDLLITYEASKNNYKQFNILDEVRFELEWMLQMQREDGGVYHKISCYHFCPFILPNEEKDQLVLAPVSTAATADFAGCLAYAAAFYKDDDSEFAEKLIAAAEKAQAYLNTHEDELYKNPPEITTGGYGDWNVKDERYFALASLFGATGKIEYLKNALEIRKFAKSQPIDPEAPWKNMWLEAFSWGCVSGYGTEILIKNADKIEDKAIIEDLKKSILDEADKLLAVVEKASFGTAFSRVFWGSNGHISDLGHMLLLAYDITGKKDYYEAAVKQLNYILGCNPMNICYVTGFGKNTVKNPHHRPSWAVRKCMPGMLSGGPADGLHDEVAKKNLQGKPSLQCFIDNLGSYSTNEIAIYWNSPFVYLMAKVAMI